MTIDVALPGGQVVFSTREGGVSEGPYSSLNLGILTDDDQDRVAENRARLARSAGVSPEGVAMGWQVHGTDIQEWGGPPAGGGFASPGAALQKVDGHATSALGVALLVLVADCLPVALVSPSRVAMLHCGWRGLAGGILAEGVRALRELGDDGPLQAAIGPGAGRCCYETGDEVRAAFAPEHADGRFLDLKAAARAELTAAGVGPVHDAGICTMCGDPSLWFSHRRDGGVTGRQAGVVRRTG